MILLLLRWEKSEWAPMSWLFLMQTSLSKVVSSECTLLMGIVPLVPPLIDLCWSTLGRRSHLPGYKGRDIEQQ